MEETSTKQLNEKAVTASKNGRYGQAIKLFEEALKLDPSYDLAKYNLAVAYNNLAREFKNKDDLKIAVGLLKKSILTFPKYSLAYSNIVYLLMHLCDWKTAKAMGKYLDDFTSQELKKNIKVSSSAFLDILRHDNPKHNYLVAKSWSKDIEEKIKLDKKRLNLKKDWSRSRIKSGMTKLRIGYVSDGFRDFPTAHNLLDVFKNHDKSKFEIFTYHHGDNDNSFWNKRIKKLTNFVDINNWRLVQTVEKINSDKIDILVDLKGFTDGGNLEIFAHRPAKINVSWLGFPGTTGADFIDYAIVDRTVVPKSDEKYWSEKLLFMPDCYRPADTGTHVSSRLPAELEGPPIPHLVRDDMIIFSSFNNLYKIDEAIWEVWMNILKQVPNSVLWLWRKDENAVKNLQKRAEELDIDIDRIIFHERLDKKDHLARIAQADIALDTRIVNGHTTTAEALRVAVPVITLIGNHFCSRVSASCLKACNMPELITNSLEEYEELVVKLALHSNELKRIKKKLKNNLKETPLLNTKVFTKNLEKLYLRIYKNYER